MSGKYEILRPLGKGSFNSVYLARHLSLEQERAIKVYPKDLYPSASQLEEARILKSLRHPGIPIIYDLEEDDDNYYLVEEYIKGESLDLFLLHQPQISPDFYYMLIEQLCDIFLYLHHLTPAPIIYRDLKPEHMILSGMQIKLIDFNISIQNSGDNNIDHFGNAVFSAPEAFSNSRISMSSDIYSIGMIMDYLSAYLEKNPSRTLRAIIRKSTETDPDLRYETVEELKASLIAEKNKSVTTHPVPSEIAVLSSHHGCGSTYLAAAVTSFFNYLGISCFDYETDDKDEFQSLPEYLPGSFEKDGCIYYRYFQGVPVYGPGILPVCPVSSVKVHDLGVFSDPASLMEANYDIVLFITDGAPWHMHRIIRQNELLKNSGIHCKYICTNCTRTQALSLAHQLSEPLYYLKPDYHPFQVTANKLRFFKRVFHIGRNRTCFLKKERLPLHL